MDVRSAAVVGGTGLVGSSLVDLLLRDASWREVTTIGRRRLARDDARLHQVTTDLSSISADDVPVGTSAAFCCLGTTIRQAGSQEAFRAVDHGMVLAFAGACAARGVGSFHVVSALGADRGSRVFYNRVKGEMERDVRALEIPSVYAYRPSLLVGERAARRPGERAGIIAAAALAPLLPARWKAIPAERVARAMLARAADPEPGFHVVPNRAML